MFNQRVQGNDGRDAGGELTAFFAEFQACEREIAVRARECA